MPFDPKRFEELKKRLTPAASQYTVEPSKSTATSKVVDALDFSRRAMQPTSFKLSHESIGAKAFNDLRDLVTGVGHILGTTAVGGHDLAKDVAHSVVKGTAKDTPLGKRIKEFPGQVAELASPEGRKFMGDTFVKPAVQSFAGSVLHPVQSFKEHPLFTGFDWATVLSLAGQGARSGLNIARAGAEAADAGNVASKIGDILSQRRPPLPVAGGTGIGRTFSENPLVKYGVQKPLDAISARPGVKEAVSATPLLNMVAPAELVTPEVRAGRAAANTLTSTRQKFFIKRDKRLNEIQEKFATLSKGERESFIPVVQGRALAINKSPQWNEVYNWYKNNVLDEQAKFNLTDEVTKRVAYQPLVLSNGLLTPEDYGKALRGDEVARAAVVKATNDMERARVALQERTLREFLGNKKGSTALARQMAKEVAPDPIYFPAIFEKKVKMADFLPSRFLQKYKPGMFKGRRGVEGYITDDPGRALAIHDVQKERFLLNEAMIQDIQTKYATPIKKASDVKPGYVPFTPEGYIAFYKTTMPLQESFLKGVGMSQDVDTAFMNAIKEIMPTIVNDKTVIGVRKPQMYQIPKEVAEQVRSIIQPVTPFGEAHEAVKLFWDTPLQAFKFSVLALSPRWVVNNTAGNMLLTAMGGVGPEAFYKTMKKGFRELIPEEVTAGGFRRAEIPGTKRVITPNTGFTERAIGLFTGDTPTEGVLKDVQNVIKRPIGVARKAAETVYAANTAVEDYFRNVTYVDKAVKAAREKIAKSVTTGIFDTKTMADKFLERGKFSDANVQKVIAEMSKDEKFTTRMVDKVDDIMNNYQKMSNTERSIIRRIVPFWSWWKFMHKTFAKLPFEHPRAAQVLEQLSEVGNEFSAQEWKDEGLKLNEVPEWLRGSVKLSSDKEGITSLQTRNINPLSTVGEVPGLHPLMDVLMERKTGRQSFTGMPFQRPDVVEIGGRYFTLNAEGKAEAISTPLPPPLSAQLARRLPQLSALEALITPYRIQSGTPYMSGVPALDSRGRPHALSESLKVAQILGLPISETSRHALRGARVGARKARGELRTGVRRTKRRMEQLRLGRYKD